MPKWQWPDARGYIGLGSWLLTVFILVMIWLDKRLLESDAFLIVATTIITSGWVNGAVSWAYGSTKGGGELADKNAKLVEKQIAHPGPLPVEVENSAEDAIPVRPAGKSK